MTPRHPSNSTISESSESESDFEVPESISLSQSKKHIQQLDNEVKNANLAVKEKQKELCREKDKRLKERAKLNQEKISDSKAKQKAHTSGRQLPKRSQAEPSEDDDQDGEDSGVDDAGLEARMHRAMKEAEEESMGDSDEDDESQFDALSDNDGSGDNDQDSEDDEETSVKGFDEADDSDNESFPSDNNEEPSLPTPKTTKLNANHLPDELFAAAFANQITAKPKRKSSDDGQKPSTRPSKRRKRTHIQKDLVLGNRVIRVLPASTQPVVPSTLPSRKTKKFLDRTLALKRGKQKSKLWERRPANIGVLRRDGPASNFVRNP